LEAYDFGLKLILEDASNTGWRGHWSSI